MCCKCVGGGVICGLVGLICHAHGGEVLVKCLQLLWLDCGLLCVVICCVCICMQNGVTAMHVVCKEGRLDMVKVLHAQGASIETASEVIALNPDITSSPDVLCYCVTQKGCTPLMSACSEGHVDIVEYLVEQKPSLLNTRTQVSLQWNL